MQRRAALAAPTLGAGITPALMARPVMAPARGMVRRFAVRLGLAATGSGAVVVGTVTSGAIIAMAVG